MLCFGIFYFGGGLHIPNAWQGVLWARPSLRGDLPVFLFLGAGPGQYLGMHNWWSVCGSQHMEHCMG